MKEGLLVPHQDIVLVEAWKVNEDLFYNPDQFLSSSNQIIKESNLTLVDKPVLWKYPLTGFTYAACLSESGAMSHTWVEMDRYINFLLHTCSPEVNFDKLGPACERILKTELVRVQSLYPTQSLIYNPKWINNSPNLRAYILN